jgi:hypothetical protein
VDDWLIKMSLEDFIKDAALSLPLITLESISTNEQPKLSSERRDRYRGFSRHCDWAMAYDLTPRISYFLLVLATLSDEADTRKDMFIQHVHLRLYATHWTLDQLKENTFVENSSQTGNFICMRMTP